MSALVYMLAWIIRRQRQKERGRKTEKLCQDEKNRVKKKGFRHIRSLQKPPETVASHPVYTHSHTHIHAHSRPRQPVEHLTVPMLGCYYRIQERAGEREREIEKARQGERCVKTERVSKKRGMDIQR